MPRSKRADVLTTAAAGTLEATAEVWAGVDRVLVTANRYLKDPQSSAAGPRELHEHLQILGDGVPIHSGRAWPLGAAVAFDNLANILQTGAYYLRRCSHCRFWFLATDARRRLCYRAECYQADDRQRHVVARKVARERELRRRERELRRRAAKSVTVKGNKGTK